jgi:hypothetical protein
MEIIIPIEAVEEARKRTAIGQKFEDRAVELGMEDASFEDLIALYEQVEDEEEKSK